VVTCVKRRQGRFGRKNGTALLRGTIHLMKIAILNCLIVTNMESAARLFVLVVSKVVVSFCLVTDTRYDLNLPSAAKRLRGGGGGGEKSGGGGGGGGGGSKGGGGGGGGGGKI
jgi:uncharacterized membrane protein YgcG